MKIDKALNGADLCAGEAAIRVESVPEPRSLRIDVGPRVGLGKTPEPWLSKPWRFWVRDNPFVSR